MSVRCASARAGCGWRHGVGCTWNQAAPDVTLRRAAPHNTTSCHATPRRRSYLAGANLPLSHSYHTTVPMFQVGPPAACVRACLRAWVCVRVRAGMCMPPLSSLPSHLLPTAHATTPAHVCTCAQGIAAHTAGDYAAAADRFAEAHARAQSVAGCSVNPLASRNAAATLNNWGAAAAMLGQRCVVCAWEGLQKAWRGAGARHTFSRTALTPWARVTQHPSAPRFTSPLRCAGPLPRAASAPP